VKKVIVLCGVGGSGKTHARKNHPELKDLPQFDIADVYRDLGTSDWFSATMGLAELAKNALKRSDVVVLEGYFLPETASRGVIQGELRDYELDFRLMVETLEVCRDRITRDGRDVVIRTEILERVWKRSGGMLLVEKHQGRTWEPDYG